MRWDPLCPDCRHGLISNTGWDGTGEHFDQLLPTLKGWMSGGTAIVEPTDGVGPGRDCASYNTTAQGISLTRGYDFDTGRHADVTRMTWAQIRQALLEPADAQLTLEMTVGV